MFLLGLCPRPCRPRECQAETGYRTADLHACLYAIGVFRTAIRNAVKQLWVKLQTWRVLAPLAFAYRAQGIRELFADFARLSLQDFAWETAFAESGVTVEYDLPDFPQSLHTVGTQARRSLTFVRPLKGCS
jgi:hypothetical protein